MYLAASENSPTKAARTMTGKTPGLGQKIRGTGTDKQKHSDP